MKLIKLRVLKRPKENDGSRRIETISMPPPGFKGDVVKVVAQGLLEAITTYGIDNPTHEILSAKVCQAVEVYDGYQD